jgi:hypothetical protein
MAEGFNSREYKTYTAALARFREKHELYQKNGGGDALPLEIAWQELRESHEKLAPSVRMIIGPLWPFSSTMLEWDLDARKRQREAIMDKDAAAPTAQGPVFGSEFHPHGTTPAAAVSIAGTETLITETTSKRVAIEDPLERRVAMVSGGYPHPGATLRAMNEVTDVSEQYAQSLRQIFKRNKVDTGRAIAAIDHVQQTKNIAMDALSLPYVTKSAE